MYCKLGCYFFSIFLLLNTYQSIAQDTSPNTPSKDTTITQSPDYLPVYFANTNFHHFYPLVFNQIDTNMIEVNHYSKTLLSENIYQSLGIFGQAHQDILFSFKKRMGFTTIEYPFPLYFKNNNDVQIYDLETSFTKIGYFYGVPGENALTLIHAQKVKNVMFTMNILAHSNLGYFLHQAIQGITGDAMIRYESPNKKYGFKAFYIINRTENQENTGLRNVDDFRAHLDNEAIKYAVNSSNALLKILTHDLNFQQYYNLNFNKDKYFGTLTHSAQYIKYSSNYFDVIDSTLETQMYNFQSDSTFDTLSCYKIVNSLQWSNFSPNTKLGSSNIFFLMAGGIMHEYFEDHKNYYNFHSFTPFVRGHIRLLKVFDIKGDFSYSFGGYIHNDAMANLLGEWTLQKELNLKTGVKVNFYRVSPNYNYSSFISNHFQWELQWRKQNIAEFGAFITYKKFKASANLYLLDNFVIFGTNYLPVQLDQFSRVVQFTLYAPFRYKGFGFTTNLYIQNPSSDSIQIPLFAAKSSLYYIFNIFKKKLKLQLGIDVMYNTSYYANGYAPALYAFYLQQNQEVGNFWYVDANATIRISRLYFFVRVGNILSPFQNYNMFTTPNYPMKDFLLSVGINWRFHD